ncbi:myo-inositol-1(or 4)-monophosphatase [Methylohalomonas lacus]|uniref:Inositol-1-monophosphatase n=1 Tax=Methylohalomonas lacus TaxID=398773 RepID=A0AAE3HNG0_9GAMM|nr:inositol monophosphatase family protein [Methylohalomonas lacus]MCS3903887.1 myo-inositol-1(or 4)-monophosphatase [Methylohalomonas lacus]
MHPMLNTATRAARAAGTVILRHMDRVQDLSVDAKGRNDFVTDVDRKAEVAIIQTLHKAYPKHGILAEESGYNGPGDVRDEYLWIIDPLDGTTNYIHGFPQFAVSIALQHRGKLDQAVVYDPFKNELFSASRGSGAQLDGKRIHVSKETRLENALLGTGFPFKEMEHLDRYMETFRALITQTAGIRRAGAAALDLAYVACGRLDGFWEFGLQPWDMAAGALLVEEAGGIVADMTGGNNYLESGNVMIGTPKIHEAMQKAILAKQAHE